MALPTPNAWMRRLEWDSEHYGRPVCEVDSSIRNDAQLSVALEHAAQSKQWLAYFLADAAYEVGPAVLARFGGRRIVGRAVFERDLAGSLPPQSAMSGVSLDEFDGDENDADVLELGFIAGHASRFRLDTRLDPDRWKRLYLLWVRNSVRREIADRVFVARIDGKPVALMTFALRGDCATIGLSSTDPAHHGRGIGRALIHFTERAMISMGAKRSIVSTQTENIPACRFYQSVGYQLREAGSHYHFVLEK